MLSVPSLCRLFLMEDFASANMVVALSLMAWAKGGLDEIQKTPLVAGFNADTMRISDCLSTAHPT